MLPSNHLDKWRVTAIQEYRLATDREQAVLGLSAKPITGSPAILDLRQKRSVLETPGVKHLEGDPQMCARRPEPQKGVVLGNSAKRHCFDLLKWHGWIRQRSGSI